MNSIKLSQLSTELTALSDIYSECTVTIQEIINSEYHILFGSDKEKYDDVLPWEIKKADLAKQIKAKVEEIRNTLIFE